MVAVAAVVAVATSEGLADTVIATDLEGADAAFAGLGSNWGCLLLPPEAELDLTRVGVEDMIWAVVDATATAERAVAAG